MITTQCRPCQEFFARFSCGMAIYGECDCPRCQGYCKCNIDVDEALNALVDEYVAWQREQGLTLGSADEHMFDEDLTEAQQLWVRDFVERWDEIEHQRR